MQTATRSGSELDELSINTIRILSADAVQQANSGHPGAPMGAAPMAYVLWSRFLKFNPADPHWPDRDRFVLSAGHASMLLYSLLHLYGYDLPLDEIKRFRQWGSRTPGHPEVHLTPGVEATTGPLGQGVANGVGMALAERLLAARFNRPGHTVVDHYTYGIVSDGDMQEGIGSEAASLAGHLRLGKLIYLYDDNNVQLDGPTNMAFSEDVGRRFEAYGWHVQHVEDGNDLEAIDEALREARQDDRPSFIAVRTTIGYGAPTRAGTSKAHGEALGEDELKGAKHALGWPTDDKFFIPDQALSHFRELGARGQPVQDEWRERFAAYAREFPEEAAAFERDQRGELPSGWTANVPSFTPSDGPIATRAASGRVLSALSERVEMLVGGSADLSTSNNTYVKGEGDVGPGDYSGRNIWFGVREHAMGGISNGMALHGGLIPYTGTFLTFSDYMRGSIRLAALSDLRVVFVFTHDSIGLGEDGPTHQPVEQLVALRAIPNLVVMRPADANEVAETWKVAMERREGPTLMALSRQGLPIFDRSTLGPAAGTRRGAYVLSEASEGTPRAIIIGTGSEVALAISAREDLEAQGVPTRVVSMPSWELFDAQPQDYRENVLPASVQARVSVEAGVTLGWSRYVGDHGVSIGLDRFGASAPGNVVMQNLGFTKEHVVSEVLKLVGR